MEKTYLAVIISGDGGMIQMFKCVTGNPKIVELVNSNDRAFIRRLAVRVAEKYGWSPEDVEASEAVTTGKDYRLNDPLVDIDLAIGGVENINLETVF